MPTRTYTEMYYKHIPIAQLTIWRIGYMVVSIKADPKLEEYIVRQRVQFRRMCPDVPLNKMNWIMIERLFYMEYKLNKEENK